MKKQRIAIYYDTLWVKGGAERVVVQLANGLSADIYTSGLNPELIQWLDSKSKIVDIGNILINFIPGIGMLLEAPFRFFFYRPKEKYDVHIFVGFNSIFAARKENNNVWFCLTPNRMLYDHRQLKASTGSFLKQFFFRCYQFLFTGADQHAIAQLDKIIAQTRGVQKRIDKYYKRESSIIYSPIITDNYFYTKNSDFFLTVARLVPEKRISLIAEAFTQMPNKKLIIVGDGPEKDTITQIITGNPNITLLTDVNDVELRKLYAECVATIYMPMNEDFGLIPLEGMSSGKICIGVNEGGCLETIQDGVNGKLIPPTVKALLDTVKNFDYAWAKRQKEKCMASARKFDVSTCVAKWKEELASFT